MSLNPRTRCLAKDNLKAFERERLSFADPITRRRVTTCLPMS
jgi:hypothetical protein